MIDILENICFFSSSTKLYGLLNVYMSEIENTVRLRNLSKTRWTALAESIKALYNQ